MNDKQTLQRKENVRRIYFSIPYKLSVKWEEDFIKKESDSSSIFDDKDLEDTDIYKYDIESNIWISQDIDNLVDGAGDTLSLEQGEYYIELGIGLFDVSNTDTYIVNVGPQNQSIETSINYHNKKIVYFSVSHTHETSQNEKKYGDIREIAEDYDVVCMSSDITLDLRDQHDLVPGFVYRIKSVGSNITMDGRDGEHRIILPALTEPTIQPLVSPPTHDDQYVLVCVIDETTTSPGSS